MSDRFVQIHTLTSYPATLLNRDDAGFAKRIRFGGSERIRVSSQCLKRHWRRHEGTASLRTLDVPETIRSRRTFQLFLVEPLEAAGVEPEIARAVTAALMAEVLGESEKKKSAKGKDEKAEPGELGTEQVTVLGRPEIDHLLSLAREIAPSVKSAKDAPAAVRSKLDKQAKANLRAIGRGMGLDAALFGRMVTGDVLARCDAAVHVAHAFTVHACEAETDYFSAMDDLLSAAGEEETQLGSGHIGTTELTSGLFYGYAVVDVPLLVSNLEAVSAKDWQQADRSLAGNVVDRLVRMAATVSPGAKLGSTAPYAYAHLVLVEAGDEQPRTLANAFLSPVAERGDVLETTYQALGRHVSQLDGAYGKGSERRLAGIGELAGLADAVGAGQPQPLADVAEWTAQRIRGDA